MDPDLYRLLAARREMPQGTLTIKSASEVLDVSQTTMQRLVNREYVETRRHEGRGEGCNNRVRITYEALLAYIVTVTTGDRAAIMTDIRKYAPEWLDLAKRVAAASKRKPMKDTVIHAAQRYDMGELFSWGG